MWKPAVSAASTDPRLTASGRSPIGRGAAGAVMAVAHSVDSTAAARPSVSATQRTAHAHAACQRTEASTP